MSQGMKNPLVINQEFLEKVEKWSRQGYTKKDIMKVYDMKKSAFYRLLKKHPEVYDAFRRGKNGVYELATSKLYEAIESGDLKAIKFFLTTRKRWGQNISVNHKFDPKSAALGIKLLKIDTTDPVEASKIYQKIMAE